MYLPGMRAARSDPRLGLLLGLLLVAIVGSLIAIDLVDGTDTARLGWVLLLLIAVSSLIPRLPAPEAFAALGASGLYGGIQISRGIHGHYLEAITGVLSFFLVAWLCRSVAQCVFSYDAGPNDVSPKSADIVKKETPQPPTYVADGLEGEIERSRRRSHPLSLLVLGFDVWDWAVEDLGPDRAEQLLERLEEIVRARVRGADTLARHGQWELSVVLPETPREGARLVAERIGEQVAERLKLKLRVGIAEFPRDVASADELVREAEAALQFARTADLEIADRSVLT
ncbi:MAG: diguanylate cyclase [Chloroflexi bacterium]|nr:diguanylate cyclase [Chloroflexota bacterium]